MLTMLISNNIKDSRNSKNCCYINFLRDIYSIVEAVMTDDGTLQCTNSSNTSDFFYYGDISIDNWAIYDVARFFCRR